MRISDWSSDVCSSDLLVRLGWRLGHKPPPLPAEMPGWEKFLSRVTHMAFYALLLILPLSGWTFSSAGQNSLNWFGLFDIPKFGLTKEDAITGIAHETHELMAYLMLEIGRAYCRERVGQYG